MTKYVALLRGIGPGNPNMRNEKLRATVESLGMKNVQSIISSGNIIFESSIANQARLETILEEAWQRELGFQSTTIVRNQNNIIEMIDSRPFGDREDVLKARLQVTFLKHPLDKPALLYADKNGWFAIVGSQGDAVFSTYDSTSQKASLLMQWLEKNYGTQITTRTWQTVHRIARRFEH